ncbi:MAG: PhoX family phosphatase [Hyphomonadaceae bacterium]|nr:MAG: twin-arginine translocation pathway signal [Caulobacteraceae bacterium]MBT9445193.1 PhoX family phosphatase [Hyphomonadaceae bacterium]TPW02529.1 MAG: twin-arginine translocation pathway signal [Alphaproteobacteria bacterium]
MNSKPADAPEPMHALIDARLSRRGIIGGLAALPLLSLAEGQAAASPPGGLTFASVPATQADTVTVPPGYRTQTLIAWGDPLFENMTPFDPATVTRADQELRFGQNNDMLALFPAVFAFPPATGQTSFLMCVNHEYVEPSLVYPGLRSLRDVTPDQMEAVIVAHGVTVVRVARDAQGVWGVQRDAAPGEGLNRRITPNTPVIFDGAAANHRWVSAATAGWNVANPSAVADAVACGTIANCAGGQTPWGTYLTAEENFDGYFSLSALGPETETAQADAAWMWSSGSFGTPLFSPARARLTPPRFDVAKNPYAPALYGWIVEIDPYDPTWTPRKRTSLGRAKHECATTALAKDGRVVVYSGDDQINEFVYKFVSRGKFNPAERTANRDLLSEGQLYAAKFNADGTGTWLALTPEAANAAATGYTAPFTDVSDVAIRCREAARLMGATPMDRPEDVEAIVDSNWIGRGAVLVACTNNRNEQPPRPGNPAREKAPGDDPAQGSNLAGHILKIEEAGGDCAAVRFRWDVFALAGDPNATSPVAETPNAGLAHVSVKHRGRPTISGDRFACPDNICFDAQQNVWISTDGAPAVFGDCNDAVMVTSTSGVGPRAMKRFLVGPVGCEICGPTMAPDQKAFLVAIQHPGEADTRGTSYSDLRWRTGAPPPSSFPDGGTAWPRSAVVVVTRTDGGVIGA